MKKSLFIAACLMMLGAAAAMAQPRAIGGRLGYGVEFSYEHGLGNNMLSIDAGLLGFGVNHSYGSEAVVTYDWINPFGANFSSVWSHKGEWNWYMGVGGGAGAYFYRNTNLDGTYYWNDHIFVGVAGRVGVEYNFWFPLQLSLDWRPLIGPYMYTGYDSSLNKKVYADFNMAGLYCGGIALGVRYKF